MKPTFVPSEARTEILRAVRAALPPAVAAPSVRPSATVARLSTDELIARFSRSAAAAGAVVIVADNDAAAHANHAASDAHEILSLVPGVASTIATPIDPHALASLDLLVCPAMLGVAESGAVWLATSDLIHRAALFIAQRVIIVLKADTIVADLHDAYERIDVRANAFGTFISGPSKTADIEQSLVIGAHGPKELTLIISGA
jgi:L-lactate dehydrogenase complex protein LldG